MVDTLTVNLPDSVLNDTGSLEGPGPSSFLGVTLNSYLKKERRRVGGALSCFPKGFIAGTRSVNMPSMTKGSTSTGGTDVVIPHSKCSANNWARGRFCRISTPQA